MLTTDASSSADACGHVPSSLGWDSGQFPPQADVGNATPPFGAIDFLGVPNAADSSLCALDKIPLKTPHETGLYSDQWLNTRQQDDMTSTSGPISSVASSVFTSPFLSPFVNSLGQLSLQTLSTPLSAQESSFGMLPPPLCTDVKVPFFNESSNASSSDGLIGLFTASAPASTAPQPPVCRGTDQTSWNVNFSQFGPTIVCNSQAEQKQDGRHLPIYTFIHFHPQDVVVQPAFPIGSPQWWKIQECPRHHHGRPSPSFCWTARTDDPSGEQRRPNRIVKHFSSCKSKVDASAAVMKGQGGVGQAGWSLEKLAKAIQTVLPSV
ncbi:hypothetical protein OIO90_000226 [Microbotryomycetes sp. JL221]|nr:hypothetical protein OIO90_000226 [Microbotryomycetes sp. JL221]